jgi:hypothetical protein
LVIDAHIKTYCIGERAIAFLHHQKLLEIGMNNVVIVYDRGYISGELVADLADKGIEFVFRTKRGQYKNIDAETHADSDHYIFYGFRRLPVRVAKFVLVTGEIETLVTNLSRKEFSIKDLATIYCMRWGVECEYKTFKCNLALEIITGLDEISVEQDFYTTCIRANIVGFAAIEANAMIESQEEAEDISLDFLPINRKTRRKHAHKANISSLISALVDYLPEILMDIHSNTYKLTQDLIIYASKHKIPIRPGRSFLHVKKHDSKFYYNYRFAM